MSFTVKRTGFNEAMASLGGLLGGLPTTRRAILNESADLFVKTAKPFIHPITRKTEHSTKKERVTDNYAIVSSGFGAPFEERRRGSKYGRPHRFMTHSAIVVHKAMPQIIIKHVDQLLRKTRSSVV